jgi:hypothetical protein
MLYEESDTISKRFNIDIPRSNYYFSRNTKFQATKGGPDEINVTYNITGRIVYGTIIRNTPKDGEVIPKDHWNPQFGGVSYEFLRKSVIANLNFFGFTLPRIFNRRHKKELNVTLQEMLDQCAIKIVK